uniref:Uncharacterized protein n=1 Tax=Peronospora matthiolae TaxID=2874970 RepID=A0AAV1TJ11_9STRA
MEVEESTSGLEVSTTLNSGNVEDGVVGLPNKTLRREEERDRESVATVRGPAYDESSSSELDKAGVGLRALPLPFRTPGPGRAGVLA